MLLHTMEFVMLYCSCTKFVMWIMQQHVA